MAWAEKLPSGRYRGVYRDGAGKRRSAGTFTHKPRAERAAGAREEASRKAMKRDPEAYKRPWGEWCEEWWSTRLVEESTLRTDQGRRTKHLEPRWSEVPLGSITRQDVKAWASDLRRTGMSPETVKRCVHLLSVSLTAALDAELIETNPAASIKLPGGPPAQERYLTHDEFVAIRDQLPTTGDQFIADLLVNTGLRWGELAGLHRARVDLERALVRVVEVYDEEGAFIKAYPKGKRVRDVPLTPEVVAWLEDASWSGVSCGVEHRLGRCPGPLLVTTESGRALRNSNWAARVWVPAVQRADVGHARIHDLRHTYASWLLQNGVTLAEVGQLLGHVSTQTTQRYAHLAATPRTAVLGALASVAVPRKPHRGSGDEGLQASDLQLGP